MPLLRVLLTVLFGFALSPAMALTARDGSIIVRRGDPGYSETGPWEDAGQGWQERGMSYSIARRTQGGGAAVRYAPTLPVDGVYRIYEWNIPYYTQDSRARIEIQAADGPHFLTRNLQAGPFGWVPLGDYHFRAGNGGAVTITRGDRTTLVDAVRFRLAANIPPVHPLLPYPRPDGKLPHLDRPGPTGHLILGGQPYLMLGGELENTSALEPMDLPYMDALFDTLCEQRFNTVEAPVSWKELEPREGEFHFEMIDALVQKARTRNIHLAILWFGTYKNLQSYYAPLWVIENQQRFLHAKDNNGKVLGTISPFSDAALQADCRAFARLMQRIREQDPDHQVVLMVQIENEMPSWRDHSDAGEQAWQAPVPEFLPRYLAANETTLSPWLHERWVKHGRKTAGTWADMFGPAEGDGGRVFGAWSYSRYADAVAAAGRAVLDLPCYINSWQGESPAWQPYMDVAHAAAPHLDFMGPDLYLDRGFADQVQQAQRLWNNVVVPETNTGTVAGARAWAAYGTYGCLYFASYLGPEIETSRLKETYAILQEMAPLVLDRKGTPQMRGFYQEEQKAGDSWDEPFLTYRLHLTATDTVKPGGEQDNLTGGEMPGAGMVLQLGTRDFVIVGSRLSVDWQDAAGHPLTAAAEVGHFSRGRWIRERTLDLPGNGGTIRLSFPRESGVYQQVRLRLN